MSITTTADAPPTIPTETPTTPPTPAPAGVSVSGDPYASAHKALKDATSWDALNPAPEAPAEPTVEPVAEPAEPEAPSPVDYSAWKLDAAGALHRPDGTFADAAEVESYNASLAPEATEGQQEPVTEPTAEPESEATVVKLRSRNGDEKEIEVTDPELAEMIRANANDGMRRDEFHRRMADVEAREADQREFETMLESNPEDLILQRLPAESRARITQYLLAQNWDAIEESVLRFYQDPGARAVALAEAQVRATRQETEYSQRVQHGRYIVDARRAVTSLIPDTAAPEIAQQFMRDAESDIAAAVRAKNGQPIPTTEFAAVLAPRIALYGFDKAQSATAGAPEAPPAKPVRPVARPVVKAGTPAPTPRPTVATPSAPGETVRKAVQAQRIAAAVPPAGAGAATLKVPLVPANATIEQASAAMKKHRSWSDVA